MKSFQEYYYEELIKLFEIGKIGFNEPDLTKCFVESLKTKFSRIGFTYVNTTLTQSNKKWMASLKKDGKKAEIGDFLLLLRKREYYGNRIKIAFVQCKNEKALSSYSNKHLSFKGDSLQHYIMSGKTDIVYLMGKTRTDFFRKNLNYSLTNYMIFYRQLANSKCIYNADLVGVTKGTKLINITNKKSGVLVKKPITIHNRYSSRKTCKFDGDDYKYAPSFDNIVKAISEFKVGAPLDKNIFQALSEYLPPWIKKNIKEDCIDYVFEEDFSDYKEDEYNPIIIIDCDSFIE